MTENIWDELWEGIDWDRVTTIPFITERIHEIKSEGDKLKEKADALTFLFGDKGVRSKNLMKIQIWREKAEQWDAFKGVVPSDSKLFVVRPEYARMSRGDMGSRLGAIKTYAETQLKDNAGMRPKKVLKILEALTDTPFRNPNWALHGRGLNIEEAEGDRLRKEGLEHHAIAVEYYEKLEAVNEWLKKEFVMSSVNPPWYTKRLRQLSDILEAAESNLKPDCYGSYGSEECPIDGCTLKEPCDTEETKSFEKARRALKEEAAG